MVLMYVPDADAVYHQALRAGATSLWYMATPRIRVEARAIQVMLNWSELVK